ncbi:nitronate monooxygenase [Antricoccus suffuscus]|uniref:Nitronate monooxygenase n=1 Tax=Antricoccus suffuscus TaxID=1629062 RepID=A0A2T1A0Z4_9ACTN|nr:nitronate monooxygenase [Antricoccus suffuscus]PRZ42204.1 nitronate monooxygenase [Antricoccus suffuscus]
MTAQTRFTARFGLQHPVMLAPMAGVADATLAAAVSAAGGLGMIGGGYGDRDWLTRQIAGAQGNRVGCGFITWSLAKQPELLDLALESEPAGIMLSFGDPTPFAAKIKGADVPLICQVQTIAQARQALDAEADIIVAQGSEAGGHGASRGTFALTPAVADLVSEQSPQTLVLAAGGVADGRGLAAALMLGADGVLVGTRFYATPESPVAPALKNRVIDSAGDETIRTGVFDLARGYRWPQEFTARAVRNTFTGEWHGNEDALDAARTTQGERYKHAVAEADSSIVAVFAGEDIDLIHEITPVAEILTQMSDDAAALLTSHR